MPCQIRQGGGLEQAGVETGRQKCARQGLILTSQREREKKKGGREREREQERIYSGVTQTGRHEKGSSGKDRAVLRQTGIETSRQE